MDERQLDAHLTQALGREARLWQGGQIQVPVPASGLPGSVFIPVLTRTRFAAGSTCTRAQVSSAWSAHLPQVRPLAPSKRRDSLTSPTERVLRKRASLSWGTLRRTHNGYGKKI